MGADPAFAPIEHGRFGAVPSSHLGGVGLAQVLLDPAARLEPARHSTVTRSGGVRAEYEPACAPPFRMPHRPR